MRLLFLLALAAADTSGCKSHTDQEPAGGQRSAPERELPGPRPCEDSVTLDLGRDRLLVTNRTRFRLVQLSALAWTRRVDGSVSRQGYIIKLIEPSKELPAGSVATVASPREPFGDHIVRLDLVQCVFAHVGESVEDAVARHDQGLWDQILGSDSSSR